MWDYLLKYDTRRVIHLAHIRAHPHHRSEVVEAAAVVAALVNHLQRAISNHHPPHSGSGKQQTHHLYDLHDVAGQTLKQLRRERKQVAERQSAAQHVALDGERLEQVVPAAAQ
jgi:CRISPR/Cas system-associated endonuclease/helicase Cas3